MSHTAFRRIPQGLEVRLHVQSKASKTEFIGLHGERLKLRVQAKPVEGAANEAVRRFVAKTAGVAKSQVEILRGAKGRDKDLLVRCENPDEAIEALTRAAGL